MIYNNSLNLSSISSFEKQPRFTVSSSLQSFLLTLKLVIPETNRFANPYEPSVLVSQRGQSLINPSIVLQGDHVNSKELWLFLKVYLFREHLGR